MRHFTDRLPTRRSLATTLALTLCLGILVFGSALSSPAQAAPVAYTVFGDSLTTGWSNWSWGSTVNFAATSPVRAGSRSLALSINQGWAGLYIHTARFDTTGYDTLRFYVNGGSASGQTLKVLLYDQNTNPLSQPSVNAYVEGGSVAAGQWRLVSVPLSALGGTNRVITGIGLQDRSGRAQPTVYLDDLQFVVAGAAVSPTTTPTPSSTSTPVATSTPKPTNTPGPTSTPISTATATSTPISTASSTPSPTATVAPPSGVSPYLWGANMDYRISSNVTGAANLHVKTLRVAGDSPNLAKWLQQAHDAGIQPLVILRNCGVTDPAQRLAANKAIISITQGIFGSARVFYEVGNENDLQCGWSASTYTASWNAMVPTLKALAPGSWFGGPTNFQANPSYISHFVHNASPKPDFISWHEYTCNSSETKDACLMDVPKWGTHITSTRGAITANGDVVPPVMITEWNYAPDGGVTTDDKHGDPVFMSQWTALAIKTLVDAKVYASHQFNVSDATPLIGTAQGQSFHDGYHLYVGAQ